MAALAARCSHRDLFKETTKDWWQDFPDTDAYYSPLIATLLTSHNLPHIFSYIQCKGAHTKGNDTSMLALPYQLSLALQNPFLKSWAKVAERVLKHRIQLVISPPTVKSHALWQYKPLIILFSTTNCDPAPPLSPLCVQVQRLTGSSTPPIQFTRISLWCIVKTG